MSAGFHSLADAVDRFEVETSDGARLPVYEAGGIRDAPGLLVGHANGLAAGSYAPWLRDLTRDFRVFAFDARGHGGSSWPEGPLETVFAIDRLADVPAYYADIRGGRPIAPEHLDDLVARYRALGIEDANPLNAITEDTRGALQEELSRRRTAPSRRRSSARSSAARRTSAARR